MSRRSTRPLELDLSPYPRTEPGPPAQAGSLVSSRPEECEGSRCRHHPARARGAGAGGGCFGRMGGGSAAWLPERVAILLLRAGLTPRARVTVGREAESVRGVES